MPDRILGSSVQIDPCTLRCRRQPVVRKFGVDILCLVILLSIPNNQSRSSKSGGHSVRLSMALRITKILGVDLEKIIRYEYKLEEV